MALTTVTYSITAAPYDTSANAFGSRNTAYTSTLLSIGVDAKFAISQSAFMVLSGPVIPIDAHVTNAVMRLDHAAGTSTGAYDNLVQFLVRDGLWNAASVLGAQTLDYNSIRTIWRDAPLTTLATTDTGGTVDASTSGFGLLANPGGQIQEIWQSVVMAVSGVLTNFAIYCIKVGAPVGNVFLEIWSADSNNDPVALLATSNNVATGGIPGSLGAVLWTLPVGLAVTANNRYLMKIKGTYAASAANFIGFPPRTSFPAPPYTPGRGKVYGTGTRLDEQNYPEQGDLHQIATASQSAVWTFPAGLATPQIITSPDLSTIVNQVLRSSGYAGDGQLMARIAPSTAVAGDFYQFVAGPSAGDPELQITYRPRRLVVVGA